MLRGISSSGGTNSGSLSISADSYLSTSNTAAQNNAGWLNLVTAIGSGAHVVFGKGTYLFSTTLSIPPNTYLSGQGQANTTLSWSNAGDGMKQNNYAINTPTNVNIGIENLTFKNTSGAGTRYGYRDSCGQTWWIKQCIFQGWSHDLVLDGSEEADIANCVFNNSTVGCIWLVNGADVSPGQSALFTNRITIRSCELNGTGIGIIDDGGYTHHFESNNYNGGTTQIRVADTHACVIDGASEFEGSSVTCISVNNKTLAGASAGGNNISITGCICSGSGGSVTVQNDGGGHWLKSMGNTYTTTGVVISGLANCQGFVLLGDFCSNGFSNYTDAGVLANATGFSDFSYGAVTPGLWFGGNNTGITTSSANCHYRVFGNVLHYTANITLTSKGSSVGAAVIVLGTPYNATSSLAYDQPNASIQILNSAGLTNITGHVNNNSNWLSLYTSPIGASAVTDANFTNTTQIIVSGSYFIYV